MIELPMVVRTERDEISRVVNFCDSCRHRKLGNWSNVAYINMETVFAFFTDKPAVKRITSHAANLGVIFVNRVLIFQFAKS
jgi:hypothetical protein